MFPANTIGHGMTSSTMTSTYETLRPTRLHFRAYPYHYHIHNLMDNWEDYTHVEMNINKPTVTLNNWEVVGENVTPYTAPELMRPTLRGEAIGHLGFDDGTIIVTSTPIASYGRCVETANTVYVLGEPAVTYMLWCDEHDHTINDVEPYQVTE